LAQFMGNKPLSLWIVPDNYTLGLSPMLWVLQGEIPTA